MRAVPALPSREWQDRHEVRKVDCCPAAIRVVDRGVALNARARNLNEVTSAPSRDAGLAASRDA